ncbi:MULTISPECIES: hypothetical protein [unclassified Paenibacillus]|nr:MULTISPECIES: hypothetical protein [unclassified Paenibacillus]MDF9843285.1 hypothetical protein [Paenibacillus sp. PastF-2]MDF9849873.1 hypothetical protein [Paenibacillus sp. PastM-2]MDF9856581.1 hypothetical protein [Paenibacillus sp. PastF-1]MDH6481850.1 hypothetical protein [Paenibacillus sp. PastH-2]MDH6509062.1 hypothetical protein [Paenibacillus sp. PastM-3]
MLNQTDAAFLDAGGLYAGCGGCSRIQPDTAGYSRIQPDSGFHLE